VCVGTSHPSIAPLKGDVVRWNGGELVSECPNLSRCPFFSSRLQNMPAVAELAKTSYCRGGHHESCARFIVSKALGPAAITDDLFPDQKERVPDILRRARR
jgi:hypothetical protein